jgi:hypothetical protein
MSNPIQFMSRCFLLWCLCIELPPTYMYPPYLLPKSLWKIVPFIYTGSQVGNRIPPKSLCLPTIRYLFFHWLDGLSHIIFYLLILTFGSNNASINFYESKIHFHSQNHLIPWLWCQTLNYICNSSTSNLLQKHIKMCL